MDIYGADVDGVEGRLVKFRTVSEGESRGAHVLGLAGKVVREGIVRARKAIETLPGNWSAIVDNQGYTIALYPAEIPHNSAGLDLPIAIMLLTASILQRQEALDHRIEEIKHKAETERDERRRSRMVEDLSALTEQRRKVQQYRHRLAENKSKYLLIGTFDIASGCIETPLYGTLSMITAAQPGFILIVPEDSEIHAALIAKAQKGVLAYKAGNLEEVWEIILGMRKPRRVQWATDKISRRRPDRYVPDLSAIEGISKAKIAMMVALAGGHNILLVGPPGQGKGMLANAAIGLLPPPSREELFEINKAHSAAGKLKGNELVLDRPFWQASKGITEAGLLGGGTPLAPGLVTLAHRGILFLDEVNYFTASMIDKLLREAMNDRRVFVQRANHKTEFPCSFILVAAMNPCKCGWYHHYQCPIDNRPFLMPDARCPDHPEATLISTCRCRHVEVERYKSSLSGPILTRIDLKVMVYDLDITESFQYSTQTVRTRIKKARETQVRRYAGAHGIRCNADVPDKSQFRDISQETQYYLQNRCGELNVTNYRTRDKVLLVSQTIADLNESTRITKKHIETAVDLMGLTNPYFEGF
jgi:magnesium chelatase family protein